MPKDRRQDRHDPQRRPRVWRPKPPDLWDRLEAVVGKGNVGPTLDDLVTAYLDGTPIPDARRRPRKPSGDQ